MDKFIEALFTVFPLGKFFEYLGLGKELSATLGTLLTPLIIYVIYEGGKQFLQARKNAKAARDLKPQFDEPTILKHTKIYIPTQFQNASPARQEEPGFTHDFVSRSPLIPFFLKKAFNDKKESERFYLILADSGMGKTTFMINLYLRYTSVWNLRKRYKMRLFRCSYPETMEEIKSIERAEAKNTILLLDALDEDPNIVSKVPSITDAQAFQNRVNEIIELTRNFCEVIITCRTQYFPGQEDDPYEINVKRPDEQGFYRLNKLYLSPFTDREVKQYLNKKFGYLSFWNNQKKKRALTVVKQSNQLVMRPMMLSYIDYLIEDERSYNSLYEIYDALIEKWLDREAEKRKKTVEQASFMNSLRQLSHQAALSIYEHWSKDKRMYLSKEEAVDIALHNNIDLKPEEVTGQSLLTCDGAGNWKFAHKSIMEFFLAKALLDEPGFFTKFSFTGMDMAKRFYHDLQMPEFTFIRGGSFIMGSPEYGLGRFVEEKEDSETKEKIKSYDETQHEVQLSDFQIATYPVTLGQFERFINETSYQTDADKLGSSRFWDGKIWKDKAGVNWRCDVKGVLQKDKQHPVIHVSWNDAKAYCKWLEKKLALKIRLPREAEWEYACRAATPAPFNTGANLTTEQANYDGNFPYLGFPKGSFLNRTSPVGSYPPNAWGLYDMHGNVLEWCEDWYGESYYDECKKQGVVADPEGPTSGTSRVLRGGSWSYNAQNCRTAYRLRLVPGSRNTLAGFRPVLAL